MIGLVFGISVLFFFTLMIASVWRVFEKAGRPGWECLIPIYNLYQLVKISGRPGSFMLFFLFPFVDMIAGITMNINIAERFGKSAWFGLGMMFLPFLFWPILGLGDSEYLPPRDTDYNDFYPLPKEAKTVNDNVFVNEDGETVERIPLEEW